MSKQSVAAKIQKETGIRVEVANGEYVVDTRSAGSSAADARRLARKLDDAMRADAGMPERWTDRQK